LILLFRNWNAVDPQKQAKMLAQFWRRFHNGGIAVLFRFFSACRPLSTSARECTDETQ
jgi:hypothetical protein